MMTADTHTETHSTPLSGLHLLLTYQCNYACDHCFVWGSPSQSGTMTIATIEHILAAAEELCTVEWIYFEGGETVAKGTPVAVLNASDHRAQVAKYDARVKEQDAILQELLMMPRAEDIEFANAQLETAKTRVATSLQVGTTTARWPVIPFEIKLLESVCPARIVP